MLGHGALGELALGHIPGGSSDDREVTAHDAVLLSLADLILALTQRNNLAPDSVLLKIACGDLRMKIREI